MTDEPDKETSAQDELKDLDQRLRAIEARKSAPADMKGEVGANQGFQVLGELLGGIIGGLSLGWLFDKFVHTTPWGIIVGTVLGMVAAVYAVVKSGQNRS